MCGHARCLSRRRFLFAGAAAGLLSACGQGSTQVARPDAADMGNDTVCVLDGLRLVDHPGPKAQIHWTGRDDPDFYCDTVEMFHVFLATANREARIRALYVQDMNDNDWFAPRGQWIDARDAIYVEGSSRLTAMGPTLASFSNRAAADTFVRDHGGQILRFEQVDADRVVLDGAALHDASM